VVGGPTQLFRGALVGSPARVPPPLGRKLAAGSMRTTWATAIGAVPGFRPGPHPPVDATPAQLSGHKLKMKRAHASPGGRWRSRNPPACPALQHPPLRSPRDRGRGPGRRSESRFAHEQALIEAGSDSTRQATADLLRVTKVFATPAGLSWFEQDGGRWQAYMP